MDNLDHRFIYKDQIFKLSDEEKLPQIAKDLKISLSTFKRRMKVLLNTELGIVEVGKNKDNKIFYKIKYSTDNKYYVTIHNDMLKRLVASTNSNMIKIYIVMKYLLTKPIYNEIGEIVDYEHFRKQITYDYLLNKIGLAKNYNRELFKGMLEDLALLGYIKIYEIQEPVLDINEITKKTTVAPLGYEYEVATFDEWLNHIGKSVKKREIQSKKK